MATTSQVVIVQTIVGRKKNAAFTLRVPFIAQGTPLIKTTPTIAAGDVKISKDGGALANATNLPTEAPAASGLVEIDLTAGEMNADVVVVRGIDVAGDEWVDWTVTIVTEAVTISELVRSTTPANALTVDADGAVLTTGVRRNTAQTGAASSITLDAGASAVDGFYNGLRVELVGGTGVGQARKITAYDGTTKIATTEPAWVTNPDVTSVFKLANESRQSLLDASVNANSIGTDAIGATQLAATAANKVRDTILSDATRFAGANVDVATSSRADGAAYTGARAAKLDKLDVNVSTRADGADYTGPRATNLDNLDALVSSRVSATSLTPTRASNLDRLDATVSSRSAPGDSMALVANAVDDTKITAAAANKLADYKIRRNLATARATVGPDAVTKRSELGAHSRLTNKVNVNGAQLEIFDETDAGTPFAKFNLVGNSSATPIVTATPAP